MAAVQPRKPIAAHGLPNRVAILLLVTFVPALLAEDSNDPLKCLLYYGNGGCADIRDRDLCLSSRDGDVWRVWNDKKHTGEACVWCNGDKCDEDGHVCLPFDQVKGSVSNFPEYTVASCDEAPAVTELPTPPATTDASFEVMHTAGQWGEGQQCSGLDILDTGKGRHIFFMPLRAFNYYFKYTTKDVMQCKAFCMAKSYCSGVEYHAPSKTCELWWYPIGWTEASSDYACWKVPGGAKTPVKINDLEPTSTFYQSDVNVQTMPGDGAAVKSKEVEVSPVVDAGDNSGAAAMPTAQDGNSGDATAAEDGSAADGSAGSSSTDVATTTTTRATTSTGTTTTGTTTGTTTTWTTTTVATTTTTEAQKDRGVVVVPGSPANPQEAQKDRGIVVVPGSPANPQEADKDVEIISDANDTNATSVGGINNGGFPIWLGMLLGVGGAGGVAAGAYAYVRGVGNKDEDSDSDDEDTEQDRGQFVS